MKKVLPLLAALTACVAVPDEGSLESELTLPPPPPPPVVCARAQVGTWRAPVRIDTADTTFELPVRVATSRGGTAAVAWLAPAPPPTLWQSGWSVIASRNQNGTFGSTWDAAPATVATFASSDRFVPLEAPHIAMDDSGNILVAWVERDGTLFPDPFTLKAARYTPASGWGAPVTIATGTDARPRVTFDLAMAGNGDGVVVWDHWNGPNIGYAVFTNGAWGSPLPLEHSPGAASRPAIAASHDLWMTAVWQQESFVPDEIFAARFDNGLHTFGSSIAMNPSAHVSGDSPAVAMTDAHTAVVTWRTPRGSAPVDLRYTRLDDRGTVSGPFWMATGQQDLFGDLVLPSIALDDTGNALAAWGTAAGTTTDAIGARADAANIVSPTTLDTRTDGVDSPIVRATPNGASGLASWVQGDGTRGGIFARRILHTAASTQCPESWTWDLDPTKLQSAAIDNALVYHHDLAMFPSGRAFAVWVQDNVADGATLPGRKGVYAAELR